MQIICKYIFVFILFVASSLASATCFQWDQNARMSAATVTQYLDCLARQPQLTRLSAQWLILKKSLFQLQDGNSSSVAYRYANNPMSPYERNAMYLNFSGYSWRNFSSLLTLLETEVFPKALAGFDAKNENNKTSWSFEAVAYQTIAAMEDPVAGQPQCQSEGVGEGRRSCFYAGTLAASSGFRGEWFSNHSSKHPALQLHNSQNWGQLQSLYRQLQPCESEADCLIRQERVIAQGLFVTLEHPALVQAVHFQRHLGFGIQTGNYRGKQEYLPTTYGCAVKRESNALPAEVVITGYLTHDHSMKNLTPYGRWAFLGRSLYIGSINRHQIRANAHIPGQFQGQNAVIRDISDYAVQDLAYMGGLNSADPKITWGSMPVTFSNGQTYSLDWHLTEDVNSVIGRLGGASRVLAQYPHSQVNSAFFTQTIVSFGWSVARWAERLKAWNPPVHYYIYAYDYGLRSAPSNTGWKSYYDRVVWVSQNLFPKVNGVP